MNVASRLIGDPIEQESFGAALSLHQQGRLREAERAYRALLRRAPGHFDALHHLGVLQAQRGRLDEAIRLMREALVSEPDSAEVLNDLGVALESAKRYDEAVESYQRAVELDPGYARAHYNLGNSLQALTRHKEAAAHFQKCLELRPADAEAQNNLGVSLHALGRHQDAAACFERALAIRPHYPEARNNLGNALESLDRHIDAVAEYERALALRPTYVEALSNLGNALYHLDRFAEAADCCKRAIAMQPDHAKAHNNLGNSLAALNRYEEALAHFAKALAADPNYVDAYNNLGNALDEMGRSEEAIAAYNKALEVSPNATRVFINLAAARRFKSDDDPHLKAMETMIADRAAFSEDERMQLCFALSKAYSDLGCHQKALPLLLEGNAIKRKQTLYDEAGTLAFFDRIRQVFTPELMRAQEGAGDPSPVPIFILGMPRSGSTLVEQILASHPKVFGAGELWEFDTVAKMARGTNGAVVPYPEFISSFSAQHYRGLGEQYLSRLSTYSKTAVRITNKMPANFLYVGLIHLALPNARIIHTARNPVDTCLSCFSTLFARMQAFSYDLGELGRYYRKYDELMSHWRSVLPAAAILDVQYEDVIADFETQARRIVAYCGLEWDEACRAFYKTTRPVKTASASQVRQPIYRTSVGRWLPYKDFLAPLLQELPLDEQAR